MKNIKVKESLEAIEANAKIHQTLLTGFASLGYGYYRLWLRR
jgi:hypothetical protein